jgi:hypothetical protein
MKWPISVCNKLYSSMFQSFAVFRSVTERVRVRSDVLLFCLKRQSSKAVPLLPAVSKLERNYISSFLTSAVDGCEW